MYATHCARVATQFKGTMNDKSKVHITLLVDATEPGALIYDGVIHGTSLHIL